MQPESASSSVVNALQYVEQQNSTEAVIRK